MEKNRRLRQWTAAVLAAANVAALLATPAWAQEIPANLSAAQTRQGGNARGLWITEIYQNDVSRSANYNNTSDHMEFVEITNTSDKDINFNDGYGLWYEYPSADGYTMKQLTVGLPDGKSGDAVVIPAGKTVLFWDQRSDLGGTMGTDYASEAQFRQAMNVPDDVKVYAVSGQEGFAANDLGFAIKRSNGETVSYYHCNTVTDDVTADGLSVQLRIPEVGTTMEVWQSKKLTTAGVAYAAQLNGQRQFSAPEDLTPEGLYITEIRPNDSNRDADFGSGSNDLMECLELTNTTDREIDLNAEYELAYRVKENSYKDLPLYHLGQDGTVGTDEGCTIPAGGTAVLWCYRAGYGLTQGKDYDTFPTEADFREAYGIPDTTPVYVFTAQNGLNNTLRGFDLYHLEADGGKTLVSRYFWNGTDDLKDNKSVELKVPLEGVVMDVYRANASSTMGTVEEGQISYPADDGSSPTVEPSTDSYDADALAVLKNGLQQGQSLHIPYSYAGTDTLPVTRAELFWKTDKMDTYQTFVTTSFPIYNKWYAFIENGYLQGAKSVDYFIKFYNTYRSTCTEVQHVVIHTDAEQNGLRVSFDSADVLDQPYSGTVAVSARDFSGGDVTFQLDGQPVEAAPAMERGAYFVFDHTGVDSYFKNGLTTGGDTAETGTIIGTFSKCSTIPTDGRMAIPVGQEHFIYNEDGTASIELALRAATYGSCWETYSDENNEDFVAANLHLVLADGTVLEPDTCKGMNITTRTMEDLNAASSIKVGDSANQYIYVKTTFTIPAEAVNAQAFALDTTSLTDGEHTLTVTAGDKSETVPFTVCNSEPAPEVEEQPELNVSLQLNGSTAVVSGAAGAQTLSVRRGVSISDVTTLEGAGDSTAEAAAKAGNGATVSNNGQYPYQLLQIPVAEGQELIRVELDAEADYGKDVQLYALKDGAWEIQDVARDGSHLTAVIPAEDYAADGMLQVLIQARTTAYTPYTEPDQFNTQVGDNESWDGSDISGNPYAAPENYDFAIAWYTDTQYYAEQYQNHYSDMVDWLLAQHEKLNIRYVFHTGDIADEYNEEYQFAFARQQQDRLEQAGIPTGVLGGNHDVAHGNQIYDLYWKYFGEEYYKDKPYYGGSYNNNLGHYDIVDVDGQEILFISMSWDVYTPEIEWINEVLDAHPNTPAILTTHCGINATADESYTSRILLEEVCRNHPQVLAILNGHYHGSSVNFVELTSDAGVTHTVYQICTDYQSAAEGGSGYIKMLYFDLANDRIFLNSYSPSVPGTDEPDVNYYDGKSLDFDPDMMEDDGTGTMRYTDYDIDVVTIPVDFDRETPKTLTVSNLQVTGLTDQELGSAAVADGSASVNLTDLHDGDVLYGVLLDNDGAPAAFTRTQEYQTSSSGGSTTTRYTLTVNQSQGGRITPSSTTVLRGESKSFTITPDEGYVIADVLVDGQSVGAVEKYTFTNVKTTHTITARFEKEAPQQPGALPFTDVTDGDWFAEAAAYVYEKGLMTGVSETGFAPGGATTRGTIVTILYRLAGSPAVESDGATWWSDARAWAVAEGISDGTDMDGRISREQLATMLYRYAGLAGMDLSQAAGLGGFTDGSSASDWAANALGWATGSGIVTGKTGGLLDPQAGATRAETAAMLMRFCGLMP